MNPDERPTIDPAQWARIVSLFHALVDQPPSERDRILHESCSKEPAIRREVESLLAADAGAVAGMIEHAGGRAAAAWTEATRATPESLVNRSLGRYRIDAVLGAGGMGTVYKAWDTKLRRDVALKVLAPVVATSAELRNRLQQEAHAASSLNHPNIVTVYEIGSEDGVDFIAAELVSGDTIRTRLSAGPLSLREVVDIGAQVATALSAAHAAGLIHRDIKPENVAVRPDGVVKVLDFGLAILIPPLSAGHSPSGGGTASYMSPEQALGERLDHRSDLFSLGVMLHEMIVGRLPFVAKTEAALVATIVNDTPTPPSHVRPGIAPAVDLLISRALEKDPELRYQSASDLGADLKRLRRVSSASPAPFVSTPAQKAGGAWRWAAAAALLSAAVTLAAAWQFDRADGRADATVDAPVRFHIPAPPGTTFTLASTMVPSVTLAVSPNGRLVSFLANRPGQDAQIWIRSLDELDARPVAGTDGASFPFWSPDSRSLGFIAAGGLKTVDTSGGTPRTLVERGDVRGATWHGNGQILYGLAEGAIYRVPANGGTPAEVTRLEAARGDVWHRWPQWLPDGRHFLYLVRSGAAKPSVMLGTVDGAGHQTLFETWARVQHVQPGYVLFLDGGTLTARAFDRATSALSSDSIQLASGVSRSTAFDASFGASDTGVLAFASRAPPAAQLTWFDRTGRRLGVLGGEAEYLGLRLSPDGKYVAASATDERENTPDIWLLDLARNVTSRVTSDPWIDLAPAWAVKDQRLSFSSSRLGPFQVFQRSIDDATSEALLFRTPRTTHPEDWMPDGRGIVCMIASPSGGYDLVLMDAATGQTQPLVATRFSEYQGRVSPDGELLAYTSDESGRPEVFVTSLGHAGPRLQISNGGASDPAWSAATRELFYLANDGHMMTADVRGGRSGERLQAGLSQALFETRLPNVAPPYGNSYVVSPDGQRFLVNTQVRESPPPAITVIVDWLAAIGRRP